MRSAFEAWAQREGHITRRREDKPEEYLVFETQRRWVIWQAALAHGAKAAADAPSKFAKEPAIAQDEARAERSAGRHQRTRRERRHGRRAEGHPGT